MSTFRVTTRLGATDLWESFIGVPADVDAPVPLLLRRLLVPERGFLQRFVPIGAQWQAAKATGVAKLVDAGKGAGGVWVVQRLVDGWPLHDLMGHALMGADEAATAVALAANALTELHERKPPLVHGDVSPGSLWLTRDGRVVVSDVGLSTAAGASLAKGTAADVYRLGQILRALSTAEVPPEVMQLLEAMLAGDLLERPHMREVGYSLQACANRCQWSLGCEALVEWVARASASLPALAQVPSEGGKLLELQSVLMNAETFGGPMRPRPPAPSMASGEMLSGSGRAKPVTPAGGAPMAPRLSPPLTRGDVATQVAAPAARSVAPPRSSPPVHPERSSAGAESKDGSPSAPRTGLTTPSTAQPAAPPPAFELQDVGAPAPAFSPPALAPSPPVRAPVASVDAPAASPTRPPSPSAGVTVGRIVTRKMTADELKALKEAEAKAAPPAPPKVSELKVAVRMRLSREQLAQVAAWVEKRGSSEGEAIVSLGYAAEDDIIAAEAALTASRWMSTSQLEAFQVPDEVKALATLEQCRALQCCPLSLDTSGKRLAVAMRDPFDAAVFEKVKALAAGAQVTGVRAGSRALQAIIDRVYGGVNTDDPTSWLER